MRVIAQMTDPDGARLVTDLTAYGSQQAYRTGYIEREASRYALFTSVVQRGDRFDVTASLSRGFRPQETGLTTLASGETGTIDLPNGMAVTVTPIVRAETPVLRAASVRQPYLARCFRNLARRAGVKASWR